MYIVDYERGEIVNMDNVVSIFINDRFIKAVTKVNDIILGRYETPERTKEVFEEMLDKVFPPNVYLMKNCEIDKESLEQLQKADAPFFVSTKGDAKIERYDMGVYYMPEK